MIFYVSFGIFSRSILLIQRYFPLINEVNNNKKGTHDRKIHWLWSHWRWPQHYELWISIFFPCVHWKYIFILCKQYIHLIWAWFNITCVLFNLPTHTLFTLSNEGKNDNNPAWILWKHRPVHQCMSTRLRMILFSLDNLQACYVKKIKRFPYKYFLIYKYNVHSRRRDNGVTSWHR